jgi:hypothetical protein
MINQNSELSGLKFFLNSSIRGSFMQKSNTNTKNKENTNENSKVWALH